MSFFLIFLFFCVCCFCFVTKSRLTLCNPVDCHMPDFLVLHYLPEFAQTHVHWVSHAIQLFHSLPPPSPPAFHLSQHQGLFQWVDPSHQVAEVLELQLQHQSFQRGFRVDFLLRLTGLITFFSSGLFSNTTVQKHQFFGTLPSVLSSSHICTWLLERPWSEVTQSCPTLCDPMDCSLSGSSIHGIFQARVLEWIAISFSRGSSRPRNRTRVSCTAGRRFTREALVFQSVCKWIT